MFKLFEKIKLLRESILQEKNFYILKNSDLMWCILEINEEEDDEVIFSKKFSETFLGDSFKKPNEKIFLNDLFKIFGNNIFSTFSEGMNHLINFGGSFSIEIEKNGKTFSIYGTAINFVYDEKNNDERNDNNFKNEISKKSNKNILISIEDISKENYLNKQLLEIKKQLEYYNDMFDLIDLPVWIKNLDGKIIFCNKEYAKIIGTTPEQIIFNNWEICDVEKKNNLKNLTKEVIKEKKPKKTIIKIINNDKDQHFFGDKLNLLITEEYFKNEKTDIVVGYGIHLKKLNLIFANEINYYFYKNIAESLSSGLIFLDNEKKVIFYNSAYQKLFNFNEKFLEKNPFYDEVLEELRSKRKIPEHIDFLTFKKDEMKKLSDETKKMSDIWYIPNGDIIKIKRIVEKDGTILIFEEISNILELEAQYKSLKLVMNEILNGLPIGSMLIGKDLLIKGINKKFKEIFNCTDSILEIHITEFFKNHLKENNHREHLELLMIGIELRSEIQRHFNYDSHEIQYKYYPLPDGTNIITFMKNENSLRNFYTDLFQKNNIVT